jgi:hypothetical protein
MSRLFALIVVALVAGTGTALADNTNCSGAVFVVPDGSLHQGVFTAPGQLRWFRFVAKADRSYAIAIENLSPTDLQPFVEFSEDNARLGTCAGPEPNTRFTETADPASRGLSGVVGSARATYVSTPPRISSLRSRPVSSGSPTGSASKRRRCSVPFSPRAGSSKPTTAWRIPPTPRWHSR